jgi:CRISPR-associated protein Csm5
MWLEIEALTPVHVGTGELLGPLEYAISGSQVGVVDLGRLFRRDPARAETIGQQLAGTSPTALRSLSLERLLTAKELTDEVLWRYRLPGSEATLAALAGARTQENELRPTMKTPDGRAYLPGTAIKGALRTALIFAWSAASPEWARGLLNLRDHRAANSQAQSVLYSAAYKDPNHDVLRALMIV